MHATIQIGVTLRVLLHARSQIVQDIPDFIRHGKDRPADADLTAEQAGRLCYLSYHRPNLKTAWNKDYLLNIQNQKHFSVLGHAGASIYIDGVTRNCTHEIIRHRWFAFSEVSQRYIDATGLDLVRHPGLNPLVAEDGDLEDMIVDLFEGSHQLYEMIVENLTDNHGLSRKEARQAARNVLLSATETKILMSGNLRAWRDFLEQRLSPAADVEIREVALAVLAIMKAEFPSSFQDFDKYGRITTDRLIKRAQSRRDAVLALDEANKIAALEDFSRDVDEIMSKGLWTLITDPWDEKMEEIEAHV